MARARRAVIAAALGNVARARGMMHLARETGRRFGRATQAIQETIDA